MNIKEYWRFLNRELTWMCQKITFFFSQQSLLSSWGNVSLPMLLSLLPHHTRALWDSVSSVESRSRAGGLVWRIFRTAGPLVGMLVFSVVGKKEDGQKYCPRALRAPLSPRLGFQGNEGWECPLASAARGTRGSGSQGSCREAAQSKGS